MPLNTARQIALPAYSELLSAEDNDDQITVAVEAYGGLTITEHRGYERRPICIQVDDVETARAMAKALLAWAEAA